VRKKVTEKQICVAHAHDIRNLAIHLYKCYTENTNVLKSMSDNSFKSNRSRSHLDSKTGKN